MVNEKKSIIIVGVILVLIIGTLIAFAMREPVAIDSPDYSEEIEIDEEDYPEEETEEDLDFEMGDEAEEEGDEDVGELEDIEEESDEDGENDYEEVEEPDYEYEDLTEEEKELVGLVTCLAEQGIVIYGSMRCPACRQMVEDFGGREIIDPIYVECTEERERCINEQQTELIPEIHLQGRIISGLQRPSYLADESGCEFRTEN